MNRFRLALILAIAPAPLFAQLSGGAGDEDQDQQQQAPVEMPDFSGLNEYIYQPKTTVYFGARMISGVKATFSGQGSIPAPETLPTAGVPVSNSTGTYVYHDGTVGPDTTTLSTTNGTGTSTTIPAPPNGTTNTWSYEDDSQLVDLDYMQFHDYSAVIPQTGNYDAKGGYTAGMELVASRDMGRLGGKFSWNLFAGMSLNDIRAAATSTITSEVTTVTDTYDLFGQTPPAAPYSSPSTLSNDVYNVNGDEELNSSGADVTESVVSTIPISDEPIDRQTTTALDDTSISDTWEVHGAYLLFRVGPQLNYDFNDHLRLSLSVGPALIYAGSYYTVTETFTPATGEPIVNTLTDLTQRLLPAWYVDATVQYLVTDRTGFYLGAVYQNGGSYTQTADQTPSSNAEGASAVYQTKVDFDNESGLRTGVTFKF